MSTQVPSNIAEIIERKRQQLLEEKMAREAAANRELEASETQGKTIYNAWLDTAIKKTPEWIRPYLDREREVDYVRIARGWDNVENTTLFFTIPGLAIIAFDPKSDQWRTETAGWNQGYHDAEPYLHFTNSSYWEIDLELVLGRAFSNMEQHEKDLAEYAAQQEERAKLANRELEEDAEAEQAAETQYQQKQAKQKAEEDQLFDAIKNDPVAVNMLRAFVMIHQERSTFAERLEDADNSLYSMEAHWSNKAAELRRLADDAQRRAEDEQYRLQNDLDDAEAKLKKLQRGW